MMTQGVSAMDPDRISALIELLRTYDRFDEGNDPYGEHDFGAFDHVARSTSGRSTTTIWSWPFMRTTRPIPQDQARSDFNVGRRILAPLGSGLSTRPKRRLACPARDPRQRRQGPPPRVRAIFSSVHGGVLKIALDTADVGPIKSRSKKASCEARQRPSGAEHCARPGHAHPCPEPTTRRCIKPRTMVL